jgi:hypothetical protein
MLVYKYYPIMQIVGLDETYVQRMKVQDAEGKAWGYLLLIFTYVLSSVLIVFGLTARDWKYFIIGTLGYFMMYTITAERSMLAYPFFFLIISRAISRNRSSFKISAISLLPLSVFIFLITLYSSNATVDVIGFLGFTRILAIPSQLTLDYYDFFSTNGFTYFSHVRGFSAIIEPPVNYSSHPNWPSLGWLIAADMRGFISNSNANFLADGLASLGFSGMFIISSLLGVYLSLMRSFSHKFPPLFPSLLMIQIGFGLTNGPFFTILLSFGGIFFLLLFFIYQPSNAITSGRCTMPVNNQIKN